MSNNKCEFSFKYIFLNGENLTQKIIFSLSFALAL